MRQHQSGNVSLKLTTNKALALLLYLLEPKKQEPKEVFFIDCMKCKAPLPEDAKFCPQCGWNQQKPLPQHKPKTRDNGQGSVYKLPNGSWIAVRVFGYEKRDGKLCPIKATKSGFRTKKEAIAYLPQLKPKKARWGINPRVTFQEIFALWLPTHERKGKSKSTINCYKAAFKYYEPLWGIPFADIGIDNLQKCIDDCPHGRRTRENMKALGTLLYAYAIPRGYLPDKVDLAHYLFVGGAPSDPREEFSTEEIEIIRQNIGRIPYADYIYCQIYLGFRPHEFLTLEIGRYNRKERCFVGGGKTKAGTDRTVTISPKIQPIIDRLIGCRTEGPVFAGPDGAAIPDKRYREKCFYQALEKMGLPFPGPDGKKRKLTPHCCRHSFATLMKSVDAPDKDKLKLIGHTSVRMLQHYQHTNFADLRRITDRL